MTFSPPPRYPLADVTISPFHNVMGARSMASVTAPASGTCTAARLWLFPIYLLEPFVVAKAWWLNGATVGTDSIDIGVYCMTDLATGRIDLIRSSGLILSAGANVVQATSTWRIATTRVELGSSSADATTYDTASFTMKKGRLYLISVENSHGSSAAVVSSITNASGAASRSSTQYNASLNRTSIWSYVATADYTGTLTITFGGAQTGCCWIVDEFSGVDTTTADGIVQQAVGTGTSVTPLATLAAFGSANNATYGAHGHAAATATAPGAGFTETGDATAATPAQALETEWRVDNDTTVDATITSAAWGSCAVELKADASPFVIPPSAPGNPNVYMGFGLTGAVATVFRASPAVPLINGAGFFDKTGAIPMPSSVIATPIGVSRVPMAGFSLRTLLD